MDVLAILQAAQAATALVRAGIDLYEKAGETMLEIDKSKVDAALGELQAANDALFSRVQSKLETAARKK